MTSRRRTAGSTWRPTPSRSSAKTSSTFRCSRRVAWLLPSWTALSSCCGLVRLKPDTTTRRRACDEFFPSQGPSPGGPELMMSRDDLRDHLEFFKELGVDGIRREAEWRARAVREAGLTRPTLRDSLTVAQDPND